MGGRVVHRNASRLRQQDDEHRGEGQRVRRIEELPPRPLAGQDDLAQAGRAGADGHGENGQHHRRFGNGGDGHFAAAAHPAEGAGRVQSAQGQEESAQRQQPHQRQHAAEQAQRRLPRHHRRQQPGGQRRQKHHIRRDAENPRGVLGDDHVLAPEFHQIKVRLPDARAAPVLQLGLPVPDQAAEERRQQKQQRRLRDDGWERQVHPASGRMSRSFNRRKVVEAGLPVVQEDLLAPPRLILGEIEKHDDDAVQLVDLGFAQVVLGHGHIALANDAASPRRQAHVGLGRVGPFGDQFRRGLAGGGKVQLVLDRLEEDLRLRLGGRIVGGQREDFPYAQIHPALAGADVADALQQLVEVIHLPLARRILEPLVVHGE